MDTVCGGGDIWDLSGPKYPGDASEATDTVYCPTAVLNTTCGDFNKTKRSLVFLF